MNAPVFGLIVIGDEILSGRRSDKHLAKCIEILADHGQALAWAEYVGDEPQRITATLRRAFASGGVLHRRHRRHARRPHAPVRRSRPGHGAQAAP